MQVSKKNMDDSCAMYHPDGTLMCYINLRRAIWYVNHDLAHWNGKNSFKLKFIPNGYGKPDMDFYTQKIEKKCVVCGDAPHNGLNKHHIVPHVFRSRMPLEYKISNHHDVVLTCESCHEKYEDAATQFKLTLCEQYEVSMYIKPTKEIIGNLHIKKAQNILNQIEKGLLRDKEGKILIPPDRLKHLQNVANTPLSQDEYKGPLWADHIMKYVLEESMLFDFVKSWRTHFITHAKPQHMPEYWLVDSPLEVILKNS